MSRYSDKKKARAMAMEAATLAALDALETGVAVPTPKVAAPEPSPRRCAPVPLGTLPCDLALSAEACLAAAERMARTAAELEAKAARGIQRGEATSMARMAESMCGRIREMSERARRYAATWAERNDTGVSSVTEM